MIIAIIQQHASSDNEDNLKRGLIAIDKASEQGAELAVFAELAFTRFFPQKHASGSVSHLSEKVPGPTTRAFMEKAKEHGMVIVINLFEEADNKTYDSSPVIDANGTLLGSTRMVHIADYDCFFEKDYYAPGDRGAPVYNTAVGKVGVAICYDRHYPEYMRSLAVDGAELVGQLHGSNRLVAGPPVRGIWLPPRGWFRRRSVNAVSLLAGRHAAGPL